ncbi:unnamed protein product [Brugia timori]|uniref:Uncharacterized protein n=1 Tax=Brugia timori TaxID=42155 RepID=A0A0R3QCH1_9BILA|nr:unnamed protein product [Brugia timori]
MDPQSNITMLNVMSMYAKSSVAFVDVCCVCLTAMSAPFAHLHVSPLQKVPVEQS